MKLLVDTQDEFATYNKLRDQGKTDSEISNILLKSNPATNLEILVHVDLPADKELDNFTTWGEESPEEPFELSTPLCNFSPLERVLFSSFRDFLRTEEYAFVVRTLDPDGGIMNFCKAPSHEKEFTDKQAAIASYMEQHGLSEIRPTEEGLIIWHENGMIENIPFHSIEETEEQKGGVPECV